jgi:hypothetical protein
MLSPFEAIANMPSSNPGAPGVVQGTNLDTLANQDNAKLAQAHQEVLNAPGHGKGGLAGILDVAKPMVQDVTTSLSQGSQAMADHDRNLANKELFNKMLGELEASGTDASTMGAIRALAGDSSDPEKNKLVWDKYIQKAIEGRKVAEETKKIFTNPGVQEALNQLNDSVEVDSLDAELEGVNTRDRYKVMERRKALKAEAEQRLLAAALEAHPDMTPEATKNFMTWAKAMIGAKAKEGSQSQTAKGVQAAISWAKAYSSMAPDALMASYNNLQRNPTFTKWLDRKNIDSLGEAVPVEKATEEFLSSLPPTTQVVPLVDPHTGAKMTAIRVSSPEGIAYATTLASMLNKYVKAQSGGVVTAANIMRYAEDLGLTEFAKFSLKAAKMAEGDTTPYTAEGLSRQLVEGYKTANRFINTGSAVQALHNAMVTAKGTMQKTYESIPEAIREHLDNMNESTKAEFEKLPTKVGDIELPKGEFVEVFPESYTLFSGASPAMAKAIGKLVEKGAGSSEAKTAFRVVGKGEGMQKGQEKGVENVTLTTEYPIATRMLEYIKKNGAVSGELQAGLDNIASRNYGTPNNFKDLNYALSTEGLKDPNSRKILAGVFTAAGLEEAANYVLGGTATLKSLQTMFTNREPAPKAKQDWRRKKQNGKTYDVLYVNGKPTATAKEVK